MLGVLTYLFYLLSKPNTPNFSRSTIQVLDCKTDCECKGTTFFLIMQISIKKTASRKEIRFLLRASSLALITQQPR